MNLGGALGLLLVALTGVEAVRNRLRGQHLNVSATHVSSFLCSLEVGVTVQVYLCSFLPPSTSSARTARFTFPGLWSSSSIGCRSVSDSGENVDYLSSFVYIYLSSFTLTAAPNNVLGVEENGTWTGMMGQLKRNVNDGSLDPMNESHVSLVGSGSRHLSADCVTAKIPDTELCVFHRWRQRGHHRQVSDSTGLLEDIVGAL